MTDEQAGLRPTASELCLGGIVKHVALVEERWVDFILEGPEPSGRPTPQPSSRIWPASSWKAVSLAELVARYGEVARRTDELVAPLPFLDDAHPLPGPPVRGRRQLVGPAHPAAYHAETAQHAGHADIIRETIDGAKTMG